MSLLEQLKEKSSFQKFQQQVEKSSQTQSYTDDRYIKLKADEAGNGYMVVRFLPAPLNEDNHFVRLCEHNFKGPTGKWYIEKSLYTLGQPCPVYQETRKLYDAGDATSKAIAQSRGQQTRYISNVYIVENPGDPSTEGKVFLFKYGKTLFEMINGGTYEDDDGKEIAINPFDVFGGANFKIQARKGANKQTTYDKSSFRKISRLAKTDDEIETIWQQCHSLEAEIAPSKFKSFDELQKHLFNVIYPNGNTPTHAPASKQNQFSEDIDDELPDYPSTTREVPKSSPNVSYNVDDDDDSVAYFQNLVDSE